MTAAQVARDSSAEAPPWSVRSAVGLVVLMCGSCGGGATAPDATADAIADATRDATRDATVDATGALDAPIDAPTTIVVVPDPGTGPMPAEWPDTEPNDSPAQAVPLGVAPALQLGPYVSHGHLGGADPADYFVFRTQDATTMIGAAIWPAQGIDLLDFELYEVVDGPSLVPVAASHSTSTAGEFPSPAWQIPLRADATYLFAILHVEGESDYCS